MDTKTEAEIILDMDNSGREMTQVATCRSATTVALCLTWLSFRNGQPEPLCVHPRLPFLPGHEFAESKLL